MLALIAIPSGLTYYLGEWLKIKNMAGQFGRLCLLFASEEFLQPGT